jgi:hypothetical protein
MEYPYPPPSSYCTGEHVVLMDPSVVPRPLKDVYGLPYFMPADFSYALNDGVLPFIEGALIPTWQQVKGLFPIPANISPALLQPVQFSYIGNTQSPFDMVRHTPEFIADPNRHRFLFCPDVLRPLLDDINQYSPPDTNDGRLIQQAVREKAYQLGRRIYSLVPKAASGHPAHISRITDHPRGPFRLYSFRDAAGRITQSTLVNVRPATYWLAHSLLCGFAAIWARPGYGPGAFDLYALTIHVLMSTRFLLMRKGYTFLQDTFEGVPSPTGLWLHLKHQEDVICAL